MKGVCPSSAAICSGVTGASRTKLRVSSVGGLKSSGEGAAIPVRFVAGFEVSAPGLPRRIGVGAGRIAVRGLGAFIGVGLGSGVGVGCGAGILSKRNIGCCTCMPGFALPCKKR